MEEDLPRFTKWRAEKAGVAILGSNKIDFKPTKIKRDKEGHYIMIKGSILQEEVTEIYMHPVQEHPDTESKSLTTYKET